MHNPPHQPSSAPHNIGRTPPNSVPYARDGGLSNVNPDDVHINELLDLEENWPISGLIHRHLSTPDASTHAYHAGNLVVVVGAYQGKVIEWLSRLPDVDYNLIIGYEPQDWAVDRAEERVNRYAPLNMLEQRRIRIERYALGTRTELGVVLNEYGTDACSLVRPEARPDHLGYADIHEACMALNRLTDTLGPSHIDLMIMNIEGYEYELLPHIFGQEPVDYNKSLALPIDRLAVQFHEGLCSPRKYGDILNTLDSYFTYSFSHFLPSWGYWYNN